MSESALLRATRDRIRLHASLLDRQVNIEIDERAPSTSPDLYVIVIPMGMEPAELYASGKVTDLVYLIDIAIAIRSLSKPRDFQREKVTGIVRGSSSLTTSFETIQNAILEQIDFDYTTIDDANTLMIAEGTATGTCDIFIEPLRFAGLGPVREAPAEIFAGFAGEQQAALIRTMRFRGARRPITRFP